MFGLTRRMRCEPEASDDVIDLSGRWGLYRLPIHEARTEAELASADAVSWRKHPVHARVDRAVDAARGGGR